MSEDYTVTLTLNLEANSAEEAAQLFGEWLDSTKYRSVSVENDATSAITEVDV